MKNVINYYYNLKIGDIKQSDGIIYFNLGNINYVFIPFKKDLELISDIYELNQTLLSKNIMVHRILLNIQGQILTYINGEYYVLMEVVLFDGKIELSDILFLNSIELTNNNKLKRNNWIELWSVKNDYLEYQLSQLGKKYPLIRESFSYYLGLAETSISLYNEIDTFNLALYLSHNRIKVGYTFYELYDPFNIIMDFKVRDAAEYFKSSFFSNKKNILDELLYFISYNSLLYEEWVLFFIRMLYPSYYFDCYEEIINERIPEEKIKEIIDKNKEFEKILLLIYRKLRNFPIFPTIDYFENKNININY